MLVIWRRRHDQFPPTLPRPMSLWFLTILQDVSSIRTFVTSMKTALTTTLLDDVFPPTTLTMVNMEYLEYLQILIGFDFRWLWLHFRRLWSWSRAIFRRWSNKTLRERIHLEWRLHAMRASDFISGNKRPVSSCSDLFLVRKVKPN